MNSKQPTVLDQFKRDYIASLAAGAWDKTFKRSQHPVIQQELNNIHTEAELEAFRAKWHADYPNTAELMDEVNGYEENAIQNDIDNAKIGRDSGKLSDNAAQNIIDQAKMRRP